MCFSVVKRRFTKRCEKKDVPAGRNRLRMILASQNGSGGSYINYRCPYRSRHYFSDEY